MNSNSLSLKVLTGMVHGSWALAGRSAAARDADVAAEVRSGADFARFRRDCRVARRSRHMAGRLARSRPADDERSNRSRKRRRYDGAVGPSRAGTSTGGTGRPISSTSWEDEDEARSSDDDVDGQSTRQVARRRRRAGSSRQQQQQQYTRSLSPVKRTRGLTRQLRDRLPILDGATLFQSTKILENVSNRPSQPRRGRASSEFLLCFYARCRKPIQADERNEPTAKETLARMKKQQIELNARSSESDASVDEQSDYDPMQGQG